MTGFTIGMIAFGIWVAVAVGLWLLFKRSPGHPFRSIGQFRRANRKLAEPIREPDSAIRIVEAVEEPQISRDQLELFRPPEPETDTQDFVREDPETDVESPELEEINSVITAVTAEKAPIPKRNSKAPARKRTAALNKPIRKIGRLTYVVVDEEGKPETYPG